MSRGCCTLTSADQAVTCTHCKSPACSRLPHRIVQAVLAGGTGAALLLLTERVPYKYHTPSRPFRRSVDVLSRRDGSLLARCFVEPQTLQVGAGSLMYTTVESPKGVCQ